jgi:hypothetical protein
MESEFPYLERSISDLERHLVHMDFVGSDLEAIYFKVDCIIFKMEQASVYMDVNLVDVDASIGDLE